MTTLNYAEMNALTSSESADIFGAIDNAKRTGDASELNKLTIIFRKRIAERELVKSPYQERQQSNIEAMNQLMKCA